MHIDIHVHLHGDCSRDGQRALIASCEKNETIACVSGCGTRSGVRFADNSEVMRFAKDYPQWIVPFAYIDLWDKAEPVNIESLREAGFRGLKFIWPYYEYDHDLYMPVYEEAEKLGMVALFHVGGGKPRPGDVVHRRPMGRNMCLLSLDRIVRSFQKLKIVLAHLGSRGRSIRGDFISFQKADNVHWDMAGSGSYMSLQPDDLSYILEPRIQCIDPSFENYRKLVFGSDATDKNPAVIGEAKACYLALFRRIGVPEQIVKEIMGDTLAGWINPPQAG